ADILLQALRGDEAREADDTHLCRRVVRLSDIADETARRSEENERAFLLLAEVIDRGAANGIGAVQMNVDDLVPILVFHLVEHDVAQDAGRIYDGMEALEGVECLFEEALHGGTRADGIGIRNRLTARLTNELRDLL